MFLATINRAQFAFCYVQVKEKWQCNVMGRLLFEASKLQEGFVIISDDSNVKWKNLNKRRSKDSEITFHSSRKSSPICKDEKRKTFSIKVVDGLGCLESRVRIPNLSGLKDSL